MIVCVCNNISDRAIKASAQEGGVSCGEDAYASMGCTFQCGCCREMADQIVDQMLTDVPAMAAE